MTADAMAQFLAAPRLAARSCSSPARDPASLADADAFAGLRGQVRPRDRRAAAPSSCTNDPRRRELSNVALLTGGVDYDVVYVADAVGEFARFVPYATYAAAAGGRQRRASGRSPGTGASSAPAPRSSTSASPAATRRRDVAPRTGPPGPPCVPSSRRSPRPATPTIPGLRAFIASDAFALDLYKGLPGSYRPWDGQLRQQIVLADSDATIAVAPLPQFLHETQRARHARHRPPGGRLREPVNIG